MLKVKGITPGLNKMYVKSLKVWQWVKKLGTKPDLPIRWPLVLGLGTLVFWLVQDVEMGGDWAVTFYPAGKNWLDPYENSFHLVYPPWLVVILAPLTLFSVDVARGLLAALSVVCIAYGIHKLGGGLVTLLFVLLTPFFITVLVRGETDAFPVAGLGLVLQGSLIGQVMGLLLLALKPQTLGIAAAFLFFLPHHKPEQTGRRQGWTQLMTQSQVQLTIGFGLALVPFFLVYGWWPGDILARMPELQRGDDITPWPWGIPIGLVILYRAYRQRSLPWAALSTFFLVPYLNWYSLAGYTAIIFSWSPRWLAAALLILSWVWFLHFTI